GLGQRPNQAPNSKRTERCIWWSVKQQMVDVPRLIGLSYQEALITLRNYDLRFSVVDSLYSDTEPRNTVMRSTPMSGSKVEKRTTVKLTLSKGPEAVRDSSYFDIYDY
ncbi:MAG: PASTA domain-containing protein, partial [Candidatus Cloacimonetes bacterium]|nr:PASTA domain-containing protein [Candidatus Cloacimonadota bacterium]